MRDDREKLQDILEAIERIERCYRARVTEFKAVYQSDCAISVNSETETLYLQASPILSAQLEENHQ